MDFTIVFKMLTITDASFDITFNGCIHHTSLSRLWYTYILGSSPSYFYGRFINGESYAK